MDISGSLLIPSYRLTNMRVLYRVSSVHSLVLSESTFLSMSYQTLHKKIALNESFVTKDTVAH